MFTVIILNKRSSDLLTNYKFLFKPFIDDGLMAFCSWNEAGTDIRSSVPDLYNIVKGKKDWKAVVLNTDSVYDYKDSMKPHRNNPFDYSCEDRVDIPHESPVPVIRITHIIGGYNSTPVKEFEKGFEYTDISGEVHRVKEASLTDEQLHRLTEEYDDIKDIYLEKEIPEELITSYKAISEKYCFDDIRPNEIQLVATKKKCIDDERARIKDSWSNHLEMNSSSFWEKNKYPNNCRFLFYELSNVDNSLYHQELTEFWLSVLTLAVNKINASTLQAYRLYKLSVDVSSDELSAILNGHLNRLTSAYASVKEQLHLRPEYTFDENEEVVEHQHIPVTIEKPGSYDLYMTFSHVGLCRDCPGDELSEWTVQTGQKKENFEKFLKTPRRSIDKSANHLKSKSAGFTGEYYELDQFQTDDLKEKMEDLEYEIYSNNSGAVMDRKELVRKIDDVTKKVKKEIAGRLTKKLAVFSGLIALVICFSGFIPYLVDLGAIDYEHFFAGLGLSLAMLLLTSLGGLAVLIFQRIKIVGIMKEFNKAMRSAVNSVTFGAKKFESYFSTVCTYMKARSVYDGTKRNKASYQTRAGKLNSHRLALLSAIDRDEQWIYAYSLTRREEVMSSVTTFFDPDIIPVSNSLYYFENCFEEVDIPVNDTGDMIFAPYRFIERLNIVREDIFDEEEESVGI